MATATTPITPADARFCPSVALDDGQRERLPGRLCADSERHVEAMATQGSLLAVEQQDDRDGAAWVVARDQDAGMELADSLYVDGDLDGLRALASTGDKDAALALTRLLADCGDLEGAVQVMHAWADAGDGDASLLAELLIKQGRPEAAERLLRFGLNLNPDGSIT